MNPYDNYYIALQDQEESDWTDYEEALVLLKEIENKCKEYEGPHDKIKFNECFHNDYKGCNWSKIYLLNGVTLILIALTNILAIFGVWSFVARAFAGCFSCFLFCPLMCAIITTAVLRFNTWGKLAALNLNPAYYDGGSFGFGKQSLIYPANSDRTYASDGEMILWTWIFMMIFCLTNCFHQWYASRPPVADPEYKKLIQK